jgi:hypothetical protein
MIMHNIIVEDERKEANQLHNWDFQEPRITPEHVHKNLKLTYKCTTIFDMELLMVNFKLIWLSTCESTEEINRPTSQIIQYHYSLNLKCMNYAYLTCSVKVLFFMPFYLYVFV